MTDLCSSLKFEEPSGKQSFLLTRLTLKKQILLETTMQYALHILKIPKEKVRVFHKVHVFNPKKTDIPFFSEVDRCDLVDIQLKPLANLPGKMPNWFAENEFTGIWKFIQLRAKQSYSEKNTISKGDMMDLHTSFSQILTYQGLHNDVRRWLKKLATFLFGCIKSDVTYLMLSGI